MCIYMHIYTYIVENNQYYFDNGKINSYRKVLASKGIFFTF